MKTDEICARIKDVAQLLRTDDTYHRLDAAAFLEVTARRIEDENHAQTNPSC